MAFDINRQKRVRAIRGFVVEGWHVCPYCNGQRCSDCQRGVVWQQVGWEPFEVQYADVNVVDGGLARVKLGDQWDYTPSEYIASGRRFVLIKHALGVEHPLYGECAVAEVDVDGLVLTLVDIDTDSMVEKRARAFFWD